MYFYIIYTIQIHIIVYVSFIHILIIHTRIHNVIVMIYMYYKKGIQNVQCISIFIDIVIDAYSKYFITIKTKLNNTNHGK